MHVDAAVGRTQAEIGAFREKFDLYRRGEANAILCQVLPHILLAMELSGTWVEIYADPISEMGSLPLLFRHGLAFACIADNTRLSSLIIYEEDLVVKMGNRDHNDEDKRLKTQKLGDNFGFEREAFKPSNLFASHSTRSEAYMCHLSPRSKSEPSHLIHCCDLERHAPPKSNDYLTHATSDGMHIQGSASLWRHVTKDKS